MTRGCDHVAEREGGGSNNSNSEKSKKTSNKPNCMGTGEGKASCRRGRGAISRGWRESPLHAWSSNPQPPGKRWWPAQCRATRPQGVRHSVPPTCQRRPGAQQHGNANQVLAASHLLPSHWFAKVPEVYRCKDDRGVL